MQYHLQWGHCTEMHSTSTVIALLIAQNSSKFHSIFHYFWNKLHYLHRRVDFWFWNNTRFIHILPKNHYFCNRWLFSNILAFIGAPSAHWEIFPKFFSHSWNFGFQPFLLFALFHKKFMILPSNSIPSSVRHNRLYLENHVTIYRWRYSPKILKKDTLFKIFPLQMNPCYQNESQ